jgi:hypothetical protein
MDELLPVLAVVVIVAVGVTVVALQTYVRPLERRLDRLSRIEGKLDALLKHSGLRFDPLEALPAGVLDAVKQGQKIEAIKRYRAATRAGLQEDKDVVEEAMRRAAVHS